MRRIVVYRKVDDYPERIVVAIDLWNLLQRHVRRLSYPWMTHCAAVSAKSYFGPLLRSFTFEIVH